MNHQETKIAQKAVQAMINDVREQAIFNSFEEISTYVKKQFSTKSPLAKSYIKKGCKEFN